MNFVNGKLEGLQREYYSNGQLQSEIKYINGKVDAVIGYYERSDHPKREKNYVDGKLEGWQRDYYHNGQLKSETNYVEGEPSEEKTYYSDGNPEIEIIYELGEMLVMKKWYSAHSGQPSSLMHERKREGDIWTHKEWYRDGSLMEVSHTNNNGERVGVHQRFYANGALEYEGNFDENGEIISSKSYDINGQLRD